MDLAYEYGAATGPDASRLWCLGRRFDGAYDAYRPGHGDSYVLRQRDDRAQLHFGGPRWLTAIWESSGGRVFVTDVDGFVVVLDDEATRRWSRHGLGASLTGVYGTADDEVWCWGARGKGSAVFRFDGRGWSETPCPIHVTHMASRDDTLVAVGHRGGVARWTGGRWIEMERATHASLIGVTVVSEDEIYLVSADNEVLEGSVHGFDVRLRSELIINSIAAYRDEVLVGGLLPLGLAKLEGDALVTLEEVPGVMRLEAREELIVCTPRVIHSTDLEGWRSLGLGPLEAMTKDKPIAWG